MNDDRLLMYRVAVVACALALILSGYMLKVEPGRAYTRGYYHAADSVVALRPKTSLVIDWGATGDSVHVYLRRQREHTELLGPVTPMPVVDENGDTLWVPSLQWEEPK